MEIVLLFLTFQKKVSAFTLLIKKKKKIKDSFKVFVNCSAIRNIVKIFLKSKNSLYS